MSRRNILRPVLAVLSVAGLGAVAPAGAAGGAIVAGGPPAVVVSESTALRPVPADYLGFSIEPANLCYVVRLAQTDPAFVQLFRDVGPGVFRVGGNTGDGSASWSTTATSPTCAWNGLVVTPSLVSQFFDFARSVGYGVRWQVPLGNGDYPMDASEAAYVATMRGLVSLDFGNEPTKYPQARTQFRGYIADWDTVYQDYLADGGTAPVTGPSAAVKYRWYIRPFLTAEASHLAALTAHWYLGSAKTSPTCLDLLADPGKPADLSVVSQAAAFGLPGIIDETNTYYAQGMPGVSNAYCSALWAADQAMNGLEAGLQGMYFHGAADYPPGNSLGKYQYYTPINQDGRPAPEYYGLLFGHELAQEGGTEVKAQPRNVTGLDAAAVTDSGGGLRLALVNRGAAPVTITARTELAYASASEISLAAPALNAQTGTTLGGARVTADGTWTPSPQPVAVNGNSAAITVPAYTGMIVTYMP